MSIWVWCSYHLHILGKFTVDIWQIAFVSANSLTAFGFCKNRLRAEQGIFSLFLIELSKKKEWEPHPLTGPSCITFLRFMVGVTKENSKQNYGFFILLCQSLPQALEGRCTFPFRSAVLLEAKQTELSSLEILDSWSISKGVWNGLCGLKILGAKLPSCCFWKLQSRIGKEANNRNSLTIWFASHLYLLIILC